MIVTGDALKHETMFLQQYGLAKVNKLHGQGKVRKHMVGQDAENKMAGPPGRAGPAGPGQAGHGMKKHGLEKSKKT